MIGSEPPTAEDDNLICRDRDNRSRTAMLERAELALIWSPLIHPSPTPSNGRPDATTRSCPVLVPTSRHRTFEIANANGDDAPPYRQNVFLARMPARKRPSKVYRR